MLPPFIIEQIKKREQEERSREEQPHLEIERPRPRAPKTDKPDQSDRRGIEIIEL